LRRTDAHYATNIPSPADGRPGEKNDKDERFCIHKATTQVFRGQLSHTFFRFYKKNEKSLTFAPEFNKLTTVLHIVNLSNADIQQSDGSVILSNIHLTIGAGEFTYLIGKTGSGKSSLLKTLYAALPLMKGSGSVAGFDLKHISRRNVHELRRKLGIVFQDFNLLTDRNVEENLYFVLQATGWEDAAAMDKRVGEVLSEVGLSAKRKAMPFELSGGEQQRVVIARALLNNPPIILADEPTGNLDPETSDDVLTLLRNLARQHNTAVLCATHDYRILQNFPARIIRVMSGKLIDDEGAALR
jgi:cell division transport system ATP-binding protein